MTRASRRILTLFLAALAALALAAASPAAAAAGDGGSVLDFAGAAGEVGNEAADDRDGGEPAGGPEGPAEAAGGAEDQEEEDEEDAGSGTLSRSGDDNLAVAVNTEDGSSLFALAFSIRRVTGDVVDQTNVAVAYSRCEACQTVAAAFQVVLVFSSPSVITPTNLALAVNDRCSSCRTAALAYQYVIGTGQPMRFTAEGNRRIAGIRRELRRLRRLNLPFLKLVYRLRSLAAQLRRVLDTELVPAGRRPGPQRDGAEPPPAEEAELPPQPTPEGHEPGTGDGAPEGTPPPEGGEPAPAPPQDPSTQTAPGSG